MSKLIAYNVGAPLEMRPASPKRQWMDDSNVKFAYRCLPLSMANSYGWEIINPSKFTVEWDGGQSPKSVKIVKETGTIFPDGHFGEGTFTWHTGYLFKTEYPYGIYVMGPPNFSKSNVTALSGIIETNWLPFTFTMNWQFTQPGKVEFFPGDVICQIFPVDLTLMDNIEPEIRNLKEDPDFEKEYWEWNLARATFIKGSKNGEAWQKDYLQGKYAGIDEKTLCPVHKIRTPEQQISNPHRSKNIVPAFKIIDDSPYYTPEKYTNLLKEINKPKQVQEEPAPVTTLSVTTENTLPDVSEKINNASKLMMVLVTSHACEGHKTQLEQDLHAKITEHFVQNVELLVLCIPETNMPFPKIQTDVVYYFAPKNQTPLFMRERHQVMMDLSHDIETGMKMMSQGTSYYETKFDESTKQAILRTEEYMKNEDVSKFPSAFQMARNLAKEAWRTGKNAAKGLPVLVSAEVGFARLTTCEGCDKFELETARCKECGCFMKAKTQLASASCPINKW